MKNEKIIKDNLFDDNIDIDKDYFIDDEREIDVSNNRLESKTFAIQNMISDFEYRLRGFNWKANGEKYIYKGNPLAGSKTIQKIILLLDPFSKAVNMIGNKKNFNWQKQLLRTRIALASILTTAYDSDVKNFKEIWRTFSNLMFNIGDIILEKNSQNIIKGYFGIGEEYRENYNKDKNKEAEFYG